MAVRHGTRSCYVHNHCRRPECVRASTVYERARSWRRRREAGVPVRSRELRNMSDLDIAWLAGLLEGEGAFFVQHVRASGNRRARTRIVVAVQMTDRDIVERIVQLTGLGTVRSYQPSNPRHRTTYRWAINALEPTVALMRVLRPLMGIRRQDQIDRCLAAVVQNGSTSPCQGEDRGFESRQSLL